MRLTRSLAVAALALAIPAAATAQTPTQTFDYTGHSGVVSGNVYVGPYTGTLGGTAYDIFCVDGLTTVLGNPYEVYVTPLTAAANIASGAYTKQSSVNTYMQAAWLALQFRPDNTGEWGDIHQAIWNITGGSAFSTGATNAAYWEGKAADNYASVIGSEWRVLTPVGDVQSQEFLVRTDVVPEPGTWVMLLTGLVGVGGVAFRRRSGTA